MVKKKVVANWKMNGSLGFLEEFVGLFNEKDVDQCDVVICPSFVYLDVLRQSLKTKGSKLLFGAQDVSSRLSGAFTGEVSVNMLGEFGVTHIIVGHSERRRYQGESDNDVALKFQHCIDHKIIPIVCVGESAEHRNSGQTEAIIGNQLSLIVKMVKDKHISFDRFVVAYEPIWAIGTGVSATNSDIAAVHTKIKALFDDTTSSQVSVLYGGSVKPDNAKSIATLDVVDGFLVGGASLNVNDFCSVVKSVA